MGGTVFGLLPSPIHTHSTRTSICTSHINTLEHTPTLSTHLLSLFLTHISLPHAHLHINRHTQGYRHRQRQRNGHRHRHWHKHRNIHKHRHRHMESHRNTSTHAFTHKNHLFKICAYVCVCVWETVRICVCTSPAQLYAPPWVRLLAPPGAAAPPATRKDAHLHRHWGSVALVPGCVASCSCCK